MRCLLLALALCLAAPLHAQEIIGAGATTPAPLLLKWFTEYRAETGVLVSYSSFGTNVGVKSITAHSVDFGAGDRPLPEDALRSQPGLLNIPVAAHTVSIVYNLPGLQAPLRLSGLVLADIYLGKITRWNDPQIVRLNPSAARFDLAINPTHQSPSSGTTYVFTSYLSAVSPAWRSTVGAGPPVYWPVGLGGDGNGVFRAVRQAPGTIGYLESQHATANNIPCAAIQNAKGKFVLPTLAATEAAAAAVKLPRDFRGSIVNSAAPLGYPLIGYTYLYIYRHPANPQVIRLVTWILTTGRHEAAEGGYAPLPGQVQAQALAALMQK